MTTIGIVGLGAMGSRIAARLLFQGNAVLGTNRTRSKADALIEQGLVWRDSPRALAEDSDIVLSVVLDSEALEAVTEGTDGILAGLAAGKVYVDMSTVSPQTSRELAERVAPSGASMMAAPVSGSLRAAEEGSLAIIVGGDAGAFERVEPLLRELGSTVTFVGDSGQAQVLKLATNIVLAVQVLAFSEGVRLAEQGGIEPGLALDVLIRSAVGRRCSRHACRSSYPTRPGSTCTTCLAPVACSATNIATSPPSSRCSPRWSWRPSRQLQFAATASVNQPSRIEPASRCGALSATITLNADACRLRRKKRAGQTQKVLNTRVDTLFTTVVCPCDVANASVS